MCCRDRAARRAQRDARRVARFNARAAYYGYQIAPSANVHPAGQLVISEAPHQVIVQHQHQRGCCGRERRGGPITALVKGVISIVNTVQENREKKKSAIERDVLPDMQSRLGGLRDEKAPIEDTVEERERNSIDTLPRVEDLPPRYEEVSAMGSKI